MFLVYSTPEVSALFQCYSDTVQLFGTKYCPRTLPATLLNVFTIENHRCPLKSTPDQLTQSTIRMLARETVSVHLTRLQEFADCLVSKIW